MRCASMRSAPLRSALAMYARGGAQPSGVVGGAKPKGKGALCRMPRTTPLTYVKWDPDSRCAPKTAVAASVTREKSQSRAQMIRRQ
jgi:hypothetical protein